ncbi:MAG TPA: HAMP domain-containing sensor histidine kinase, partial [Chiayiivirga sp.]|nr:HAMP domain-containing sensor histidine kinase [Chiayiivirga sp.]
GKSQTNFTFDDTLTQIGLGYFALFLLAHASRAVQIGVTLLILVGYWGLFAAWPLPPTDFDWQTVGIANHWPHLLSGFEAHWNKNLNPAGAFDQWFMNLFPREKPYTYCSGGYCTLSFIPTLATMLLVLDELEASELPPGFGDDIALLRTLAETCRDRVRELARAARRGEEVDLEAVVSRWHLLRPAVALEREATLTDGVRVDAAVGHLLRVLLDNAADAIADAGTAAGDARVRLGLRREEAWLVGWVRDRGPGLSPQQAFSTSLRGSSKPEGLGVGLALSRAALERLGGELRVETAAGEGTCVHFRVPLAATDAA